MDNYVDQVCYAVDDVDGCVDDDYVDDVDGVDGCVDDGYVDHAGGAYVVDVDDFHNSREGVKNNFK